VEAIVTKLPGRMQLDIKEALQVTVTVAVCGALVVPTG
jgi:hypothetical protein